VECHCEADKISVRPRQEEYVLLFEKVALTDEDKIWKRDDIGTKVWFHVKELDFL